MRRAVCIDFDGTIAITEYPDIISLVPAAKFFIECCQVNNIAVILWTCRTGHHLEECLAWCEQNGIMFDAVNENLPDWMESYSKVFPEVDADCRKVCASLYIDDRALGGIDWKEAFAWICKSDQNNPL